MGMGSSRRRAGPLLVLAGVCALSSVAPVRTSAQLTMPDTITGTFSSSTAFEADTFTLSAAAGDRVFLDLLDTDAVRLNRLNQLLEALPEEKRQGLRPVKLLVLRPSVDLGRLADEYEPQLPRSFRFLTRGLGTKETRSPDFVSLVLFQPDYVRRIIEIGEKDAEASTVKVRSFLED